mmetsp:Transcript_15892/g.49181  ORF Transcript_15892/g.49181 Transcript_15892/m.49181 type:complete len:225 (+) Transcript_15892:1732-2406(+)
MSRSPTCVRPPPKPRTSSSDVRPKIPMWPVTSRSALKPPPTEVMADESEIWTPPAVSKAAKRPSRLGRESHAWMWTNPSTVESRGNEPAAIESSIMNSIQMWPSTRSSFGNAPGSIAWSDSAWPIHRSDGPKALCVTSTSDGNALAGTATSDFRSVSWRLPTFVKDEKASAENVVRSGLYMIRSVCATFCSRGNASRISRSSALSATANSLKPSAPTVAPVSRK